ncbi:MAG: signal peptidase I [Oscillospiraceae bacterium]|nr:signal peptidase I [Oscillospiraceae bacterium]
MDERRGVTGAPAEGAAAEKKRFLERYNALKLGWLHDAIHFALLLLALIVLFRFVIGFSMVGGSSMEPMLHDGEIVLYLRLTREYCPGDVVSLRVPSGDYYVKRVAAVGGDRVELHGGQLYINGEPADDPWALGLTYEEKGAVIYPYTVTEGCLFLLGDNRAVSMDSRSFGEVNRRQIKGKILLRIGTGGISVLKGASDG